MDTSPYRSIFGKNVLVFDERMDQKAVQRTLNQLHELQSPHEFGSRRYAILFKPGTYDLEINVDFYVQALGLGQSPDDTTINGTVQSQHYFNAKKVTTQFWRGAENLHVMQRSKKWIVWAVSQAAPYRRMHVSGDINFDLGSWASGGVLVNSVVSGRAGLTSGQQWFTRNAEIGRWEGGHWNRVFVGVKGAPTDSWPEQPTTVIETTPVIREKPFLTIGSAGDYFVFVPDLQYETSGVTWKNDHEAGNLLPISDFYIAGADADNAASLNAALEEGKHILFTPGIYALEGPLKVTRANVVLLGIGLPTFVPQNGTAVILTADVPGVIIAGIMVDAGLHSSASLIEVGPLGSAANHADNPASLHDVYCRVGGAIAGTAEVCITINSNHVIADHLWLWRADHGAGADWQTNKSQHGLVVNGDDVTIYGLFNEHFQNYQTLWSGERGRTYFYQSEIPYSPPSNREWNDDGKPGFASYKVTDGVKNHQAWGLGVYAFFKGKETIANNVRVENAIEAPDTHGITFHHIATFSGPVGGINHVINGAGPATEAGMLNFYEGFVGRD